MIGEFLIEALVGVFPIDLPGGSPHMRAYRNAWKRRILGQGFSQAVLQAALKEHSVPGAYGPHDAPAVLYMYEAWEAGMHPKEARRAFGRKFDHPRPRV